MKLKYNHNGETNKIEFSADQTTPKPRVAIYHNGQTWYVPRVPADSSNASNFTFWHNGEHLALSSGAGTPAVFNDGVYEFYDSNSNLLFSLSGLRSDLGNLSISDNLIFSSRLNNNIGSIDANIVTLNANALSENDAVSIGGDYKLALGNDVTKLVTALSYIIASQRTRVTVTTAGYAINATGDIVYKSLGSLGRCKVSLPSGVSLNATTFPTFFAPDGLAIKIISVDAFGSPKDTFYKSVQITLNDTAEHIGVYLVPDDVAFDGINEGMEEVVAPNYEKINDSTIAYFTGEQGINYNYQILGIVVGDVVDYSQQINFVHYNHKLEKFQRYTISGLTNLPADDENFDTIIKQHISMPDIWYGGKTNFVKIEDTTFLPTSGTVTMTFWTSVEEHEDFPMSLTGPENSNVTFETITQIVEE